MRNRIGRNTICPCGSGQKYKRCCLNGKPAEGSWSVYKIENMPEYMKIEIKKQDARERQRISMQGYGKPILATEHLDGQAVIVGNDIFAIQGENRTFHDFLCTYIEHVFGVDWFQRELAREYDVHPLIVLYKHVSHFFESFKNKHSGVGQEVMSGAVSAYLALAYNLYILHHNVEISKRLVHRLKDPSGFKGAFYETFIDALFIKTGFNVELEDESGRQGTACEFVATHKESGRKFSIEAKAREPNKDHNNIRNQLYKALQKNAKYERVIFIELNSNDNGTFEGAKANLLDATAIIRRQESVLTIDGEPAPEAYVFITNYSYHYHLDSPDYGFACISEGFKIPDFKSDMRYQNGKAYLQIQQKHHEMFKLLEMLEKYYIDVPATFHGELPEFAFVQDQPRLLIGNQYLIPNKNNEEVEGVLEQATVLEGAHQATVSGIYRLNNGERIIATTPLSDSELRAYKNYPDTFFGIYLEQVKKVSSGIELFEVFYETYKHTPRDKLLEWMEGASDIEALKLMSSEDLAIVFCERTAAGAIQKNNLY